MRKNQYAIMAFLTLSSVLFFGRAVLAVNPSITIDGGKSSTTKREVTLTLILPKDAKTMMISNQGDFSDDTVYEPVKNKKTWYLSYGKGSKNVFVKFTLKDGTTTQVYHDNIILSIPDKPVVEAIINDKNKETASRQVTLTFLYPPSVEQVAISNSSDYAGAVFETIQPEVIWVLSAGSGKKTVYVKFRDANNNVFTYSTSIVLNETQPIIAEGTLLKGPNSPIYYMGADGKIHPFSTLSIFHTWYKDFADVVVTSKAQLASFQIGSPMCVRAGTWLVQFTSSPSVYIVEPGCVLRPLRSEAEAYIIYGSEWKNRIVHLDAVHQTFYTIVDDNVTETAKKIVDQDGDGVSAEKEKEYGSSEKKKDTDQDGLSDYEEIFFWLSDPKKKDTDEDGVWDGQEVLDHQSPSGSGVIEAIPENTYAYPYGSLIWEPKKKAFYYHHSSGPLYSVGSKQTKGTFTNAPLLDPFFALQSPFSLFPAQNKGGSVSKTTLETTKPTLLVKKQLIAL